MRQNITERNSTENSFAELDDNVHIVIDNLKITEKSKKVIKKENAVDTTTVFDIGQSLLVGELQLTIREIDNGDKFVFTKFINKADEGTSIPFQLVFKDTTSYDLFPFSEEIPQEHDRVFGIDYTTNVKGLYTMNGEQPYELYLSQNYISNELIETYESGAKSILRELVNEDQYLDIVKNKDSLTFNMKLRTTGKDQISENWFLLSKEELFSSEEEIAYYKNLTNYEFIKAPKWQTADGIYTKLPWSIEPGTKLGYGRNLVSQQGKAFAERYKDEKDRFYYDMLVNSVNYLFDFKGNDPIWKTEYTSAWLKREYGIIAPYVDTRHNENIALFLSRAGSILENEKIIKSDLLYADFLSTQSAIGNTLLTDNGYYILDYYSEQQTKKTHVSLNHALGEMNFLLETYKKTDKKKYLETALNIKEAVEDTGDEWINKTNGDLWYQINGDYSFEGKDYDMLTLRDLVQGISNFDELELPYNEEIYRELIEGKIRFIIENDVEISDVLYEDLLLLSYGDLIEGYEHIYSYKE